MAQITVSRNIYIIGAQSTGKTTIVKALEEIFRNEAVETPRHQPVPSIISEVARTVLTTHNFSRHDIKSDRSRALDLQRHILRAQHAAETAASSSGPDVWYISDRSGIDPIVYASVYVGPAAERELLDTSEWAALERRMRDGLVFLCEAGTDWLIDDGTRLMPENRDEWISLDAAFRKILEARDVGYAVIPSHVQDISERTSLVLRALSQCKGAS